ncbi:hypothetical protein PCE1_000304 [Barthelona sp. PCE]
MSKNDVSRFADLTRWLIDYFGADEDPIHIASLLVGPFTYARDKEVVTALMCAQTEDAALRNRLLHLSDLLFRKYRNTPEKAVRILHILSKLSFSTTSEHLRMFDLLMVDKPEKKAVPLPIPTLHEAETPAVSYFQPNSRVYELEQRFVNDFLYVVQGYSGTYFSFDEHGTLVVDPTVDLPPGILKLISKTLKTGFYYKELKKIIERKLLTNSLIQQQIYNEINQMFREYGEFLVVINSKVQIYTYLSFLHLNSLFTEWNTKFQQFYVIVNRLVKDSSTKIVMEELFKLSFSGNSEIESFSKILFCKAFDVYYQFIDGFVNKGELIDVYQDFFVKKQKKTTNNVLSMFYFTEERCYNFISEDIYRSLFQIGLYVNFLRLACDSPSFHLKHDLKEDFHSFLYEDELLLSARLKDILKDLSAMVKEKILVNFKLKNHLDNILNYCLYQNGHFFIDFYDILKSNNYFPTSFIDLPFQNTDDESLDHLDIEITMDKLTNKENFILTYQYKNLPMLDPFFTNDSVAVYKKLSMFIYSMYDIERKLAEKYLKVRDISKYPSLRMLKLTDGAFLKYREFNMKLWFLHSFFLNIKKWISLTIYNEYSQFTNLLREGNYLTLSELIGKHHEFVLNLKSAFHLNIDDEDDDKDANDQFHQRLNGLVKLSNKFLLLCGNFCDNFKAFDDKYIEYLVTPSEEDDGKTRLFKKELSMIKTKLSEQLLLPEKAVDEAYDVIIEYEGLIGSVHFSSFYSMKEKEEEILDVDFVFEEDDEEEDIDEIEAYRKPMRAKIGRFKVKR